jgi:hypothetical protein
MVFDTFHHSSLPYSTSDEQRRNVKDIARSLGRMRRVAFAEAVVLVLTPLSVNAQPGVQAGSEVQHSEYEPGPTASKSAAPAEQRIVDPAPTDPLVVRRNANAQAAAEYRASKQASKRELSATVKDAKARYKEEVENARINRKADRDAASNALKASEFPSPDETGTQR